MGPTSVVLGQRTSPVAGQVYMPVSLYERQNDGARRGRAEQIEQYDWCTMSIT